MRFVADLLAISVTDFFRFAASSLADGISFEVELKPAFSATLLICDFLNQRASATWTRWLRCFAHGLLRHQYLPKLAAIFPSIELSEAKRVRLTPLVGAPWAKV